MPKNIMKKIPYSLFGLFVLLPVMANAATFSFSPSTGSFAPGETISVTVYANPGVGEEVTVAKFSAEFSANTLEVLSFTQASDWMPLVVPGSDLIDNTAGKLVKTAGFPARLKETKQFGTIIFKAKAEGAAIISIADDSMFLDITNTNKYVTSEGADFTVKVSAPTQAQIQSQTQTISTKPVPEDKQKEFVPVIDTEEKIEEYTATTTEDEVVNTTENSQLAAIATAETGQTSTKIPWYYILIGFSLLIAGIFILRKKTGTL